MTLSQWSKARAHKDFEASLQTYQVGAHFEGLNEPVLMVPYDSRYSRILNRRDKHNKQDNSQKIYLIRFMAHILNKTGSNSYTK